MQAQTLGFSGGLFKREANTMLTVAIIFFTLLAWLGMYLVTRDPANQRQRATGVGLLAYALVLGYLLVVASPWSWLLLAAGLVMLIVDIYMAWRNIINLGEAFWPDFFRSLDGAVLYALCFGTPIALTMLFATGSTPAMRLLLLVMLTLAIVVQVFAEPLQAWLDRVAFPQQHQLQQTRADLRVTAENLPRVDDKVALHTLDEAEFTRLTRRALSHLGDLPRLAASPLMHLPAIDARLTQPQQSDNTLERAALLKQLLTEAILRLKPPGDGNFDTSDSWRHYNALYFPYVVGLKPYSRRNNHHHLDHADQQALEWFRAQVPERTLYNWQNAAAKLLAHHLRETSNG